MNKKATLYTSWVKPMLQEGSLFGIFFGDELGWQCVSWANLTEAIDTVRADIPRGDGILCYNEGYPVFTDNVCDPGGDFKPAQRTNFSYPSVPDGLDWISVDYYPDEGTLAGVPKLYEQHIYPKMAAHQKALFVPPAYSCNTTACSNRLCCSNNTRDGPDVPCNGDCTAAMLQRAKGATIGQGTTAGSSASTRGITQPKALGCSSLGCRGCRKCLRHTKQSGRKSCPGGKLTSILHGLGWNKNWTLEIESGNTWTYWRFASAVSCYI